MENIRDIDKNKFKLIQLDEKIHDTKFETKAIGYFGDALRRFSRNKSSVVAFIIL
jgi:oligopeptide transport system permease protein